MVRKALGGVMFVTLFAVALGCGGFDEGKAKQRCDQEQLTKAACVTGEEYDECVACYMQCGDACDARATCPETYSCE
jgi:hypothetical protein